MKINRVLRCTAFLLVFSTFCQTVAFARKPLGGPAIREKAEAIGLGEQCRVKLVDGSQVKGMIVRILADSLTLKTEGVQEPQRIDYAQVTAVQRSGMPGKAKRVLMVTAGITVGVVTLCWLSANM
jgi:hypothetical protein